MKIAITHPYAWPEVRRGAERMIVETSRALAARGHQVTLYTSGRPDVQPARPVRIRRLFDDEFLHEVTFGARVSAHLLAGRYDVVHCMMPFDAAAAVVTRRVAGHRVVYEELGIPYPRYWDGRRDGAVRRWLVGRVDVYGCMSEFAADVLQREFGRRAEIIPGGVRIGQFEPAARAPEPTILFSGALTEPRKGLGLLLEAVARLAERQPAVRLWLSGPGDPGPILARAPARARERVEVLPLGAPEDQGTRSARAWVTALPSENDSFGLVLIESLASGTPIVVADSAAPPALVTPRTGAVCRPGDAASLADALERALDLARLPGTAQECRDFATRFDWDGAIAPRLEDLYDRGRPSEVPV